MSTIADLLPMDSFRRAGMKHGGEYHGPDCPFCGSGTDRFVVWPHERGIGTYWCRRCQEKGDAIDLLRQRDGLTFAEACARLGRETGFASASSYREGRSPSRPSAQKAGARTDRPALAPPRSGPSWSARSGSVAEEALPPELWSDQARALLPKAIERLWSHEGEEARAYLLGRGLTEAVVREACLGFIATNTYICPTRWGLDAGDRMLLPRGIVIPTAVDQLVTSLKVRRLSPHQPKYHYVRGGVNRLHGLNALQGRRPLVLVEGEFDRLALRQEAGDRVDILATGSAGGGHGDANRLGFPPLVLLAFDDDKAGDDAARWWQGHFGSRRVTTRRLRPVGHDVNDMLLSGVDLRVWIDAALAPGDTAG